MLREGQGNLPLFFMHTFDLHAKLRRLNKGLYINTDQLSRQSSGELCLALQQRSVYRVRVAVSSVGREQATAEDNKYLSLLESGDGDAFVLAVSFPWVPEYDEFVPKTGKLLKRGWRSLALMLVKKKLCTLTEARKAFSCASLGETTYDKADYEGKLRLCHPRI